MGERQCEKCGKAHPADEWARALKNSKDYRALASYIHFSRYGAEDPSLFREKEMLAKTILIEAGSLAVDVILDVLASTWGHQSYIDLAEILVRIGDPKGVPLLKKLLDKGEFDRYADFTKRAIQSFVDKYPQVHGEAEKVFCAICGKARLITETQPFGNKRLCYGACWANRGRFALGRGYGCPYYADGICTAGGEKLDLCATCSLVSGSYFTNCAVYALHTPRGMR